MIELFGIIPSWFIAIVFAATLVVNRAGASKIFFDVVGTFQANRLIMDADTAFTTFQALGMDAFSGIEEAAMMLNEQIQAVVDATVPLSREIAAARIEFDKFISDARQADLGNEIKDIGVQFGFTGDQALRAGAKMAQLSGLLGEESVPAATEMSLAFGMIGEMESEQAMQRLINLHQQTGFMLRGTTQAQFDAMSAQEKANQIRVASIATLNELNAVEDHSAANMERITFVMNQFASQAHLTGESIASMAAMSATLIEAGEEQGKAGRALRMIYARLGADTNGAASELEKLGIATRKADGTLRPLSDILVDLDRNTVNLSKAERQRIAQVVAGNNHYVRMLKLMENTDRVIALTGEAAGNTAPIVDILNDRFADTSVQLTQAETALNNVRARIGDELLPVVKDATEMQVAFNDAYLGLLQTPGLGDFLQKFIAFQQVVDKTLGPMFSMFLNIKQMNLALMTAVQVARALNGTQVAGFSKLERRNQLEKELAKLQQVQNLVAQQKNIHLSNAGLLMEGQLADAREKAIIERYSTEEGKKELQTDLHITKMLKDRVTFLQSELKGHHSKIKLKEIEIGMSFKELAMQRFKNGQIKTEGGIQNSINGMMVQAIGMGAAKLEQMEQELKLGLHHLNTLGQEALFMDMINREGAERVANATRVKQIEQEILGINQMYDFSAQQRMSNSLMAVQIGAMGVSMAFGMLGDTLGGDFIDKQEAAQVSMVMMTMSMALLIPEMFMMTSSMATLATTAGGATVANEALAGSNMLVTNTANAAGNATRGMYLKAGIAGVVMLGLSIAIVKAANHFGLFEDALGDLDFEGIAEDASAASQLMLDDIIAQQEGVLGLIDTYNEAGEAVQKFGSTREELFFGFKAGNVTGDLVKQVQQQGVENFVANTEIIMTNNFNGMTTDEVADTILEKIEERAAMQNIGISGGV